MANCEMLKRCGSFALMVTTLQRGPGGSGTTTSQARVIRLVHEGFPKCYFLAVELSPPTREPATARRRWTNHACYIVYWNEDDWVHHLKALLRRQNRPDDLNIRIAPVNQPNPLDLDSKDNIPVAILSSDTFDATTVDPSNASLAGPSVRLLGNGKPQAGQQDVNGDGLVDQAVHFRTLDLQLEPGDARVFLGQKI